MSVKPVYHQCDSSCRDMIDVSTVEEGYGTTFVPGACKHRHAEPVESVSGDILFLLCLCCDHVIPEEREAR